MFDAIARRYDLLNHLLSGGLDRRWRRLAIESLALAPGDTLLDVCTGTGDVLVAALSSPTPPGRVVGVDFAGAMLEVARAKLKRDVRAGAWLVRGDATRLPLPAGAVAAATVAFGIRNVADLGAALAEMARVLRPGGRLAILEFGLPTAPGLCAPYAWYLRHVLPRVGRLISRHHSAYAYLNASVEEFPSGQTFVAALETAGFSQVRADRLTLGIVYLYVGRRP
jgi:demethylmenaquinone methyltransferase/2-methoxy-6-polyprenyl-1,4-benzoquinol methylase